MTPRRAPAGRRRTTSLLRSLVPSIPPSLCAGPKPCLPKAMRQAEGRAYRIGQTRPHPRLLASLRSDLAGDHASPTSPQGRRVGDRRRSRSRKRASAFRRRYAGRHERVRRRPRHLRGGAGRACTWQTAPRFVARFGPGASCGRGAPHARGRATCVGILTARSSHAPASPSVVVRPLARAGHIVQIAWEW